MMLQDDADKSKNNTGPVVREIPADDDSILLPADYPFEPLQAELPSGRVELTPKYKKKVFAKYYNPDILVYSLRLLGRFQAMTRDFLAEEGSFALSSRGAGLPAVTEEEMRVAIDLLNRKGFLYLINSPRYGELCIAAFRLTSKERNRFDSDVQLISESKDIVYTPSVVAGKVALALLQKKVMDSDYLWLDEFPELLADTNTFVEKLCYGDYIDLMIGSFALEGEEARLQKKINRLCAEGQKVGRLAFFSADVINADRMARKYLPAFPGSDCYVYSLQDNRYYSYPGHELVADIWQQPLGSLNGAGQGWGRHGTSWKRTRRGWR